MQFIHVFRLFITHHKVLFFLFIFLFFIPGIVVYLWYFFFSDINRTCPLLVEGGKEVVVSPIINGIDYLGNARRILAERRIRERLFYQSFGVQELLEHIAQHTENVYVTGIASLEAPLAVVEGSAEVLEVLQAPVQAPMVPAVVQAPMVPAAQVPVVDVLRSSEGSLIRSSRSEGSLRSDDSLGFNMVNGLQDLASYLRYCDANIQRANNLVTLIENAGYVPTAEEADIVACTAEALRAREAFIVAVIEMGGMLEQYIPEQLFRALSEQDRSAITSLLRSLDLELPGYMR